MPYDRILLEKTDYTATLTINMPERNNALDAPFFREFGQCMDEVSNDDDVRAIILTGAGRFFCPGVDVMALAEAVEDSESSGWGSMTFSEPFGLAQVVSSSLRSCHKPTIAAINGPVAGVGVVMICLCDYRIASDRATFTPAFVKLGLASEMGLTYILPRITNPSVALDFLSTGETRDAKWAEKVGLIREVASHEDLMTTANALATTLSKMPPVTLRTIKQLVYGSLESDFNTQLKIEAHAASLLIQTEDHREAIRSFIEKRPPVFKGI